MRVLVTGGTGTLGRELVPRLQDAGHTVRVMSRRPGASVDKVEHVIADLATGVGVSLAVDGCDVVAHLASAPYRRGYTRRVDVDGTGRLAAAARAASIRHFVFVSIVGVDRIPWPYFRMKLAAERQVRAGGIAWSVLRATQFHTLIDTAFSAISRLPIILGPAHLVSQPVDPG